jgi:hypothetical protein
MMCKNIDVVSKDYRRAVFSFRDTQISCGYGQIYYTSSFKKDVHRIYGEFNYADDGYSALGITIQGAPVFVECIPFSEEVAVCNRMAENINIVHPAVSELFHRTLVRYDGLCRCTSIKIHPMTSAFPSNVDVVNYEVLRTNLAAPKTYDNDHPLPFLWVNIHNGKVQILGYWVFEGRCYIAETICVQDDDRRVKQAWLDAKPWVSFSEEAKFVEMVRQNLSETWKVELRQEPDGSGKTMLVRDSRLNTLQLKFDQKKVLGLSHLNFAEGQICFEDYVDWEALFKDMIALAFRPKKPQMQT